MACCLLLLVLWVVLQSMYQVQCTTVYQYTHAHRKDMSLLVQLQEHVLPVEHGVGLNLFAKVTIRFTAVFLKETYFLCSHRLWHTRTTHHQHPRSSDWNCFTPVYINSVQQHSSLLLWDWLQPGGRELKSVPVQWKLEFYCSDLHLSVQLGYMLTAD